MGVVMLSKKLRVHTFILSIKKKENEMMIVQKTIIMKQTMTLRGKSW